MNLQSINLTAAELKAIEDHKYFLSQQRGSKVTIEEAIEDFVRNFAEAWRKEKLRRDNLAQQQEIEKHKCLRSKETGYDIGSTPAAEEWCQKYAHIWRSERESIEKNGLRRIFVTIRNPEGLHLRAQSPWLPVWPRALTAICMFTGMACPTTTFCWRGGRT